MPVRGAERAGTGTLRVRDLSQERNVADDLNVQFVASSVSAVFWVLLVPS